MFGSRTPHQLAPSPFSLRLEALLAQWQAVSGGELLDLTVSNPTTAGLDQPTSVVLQALGQPQVLRYAADPRGSLRARRAVADYYATRPQPTPDIPLEQIFLTASTSEAYGFLFKLLTNPGDEILVPVPSYPLFEHLVRLEAVTCVPYSLEYDGQWFLNDALLEARITPRTRAIILVNPNNPTGSYLKRDELQRLYRLCERHGLALISDEVFADYPVRAGMGSAPGHASNCTTVETVAFPPAEAMYTAHPPFHQTSISPSLETPPVLSFSMGGLSKTLGLPQLKLGWILVNGPAQHLPEALARLEFITDTYLSVGAPVQEALPTLLAHKAAFQTPLLQRLAENRRVLEQQLPRCPEISALRTEGGWYQLIQVPRVLTEEDWVVTLLERDGVLVQPGFFFDFEREAFLVISLLTPPNKFASGIERLLTRVHRESHR